MKTGARGLALLKAKEKCELKVYLCPAGKPTIGWGHRLLPGEKFPEEGISQLEADALLVRDLLPRERAVQAGLTVKVTQAMFDALVVFTFNAGIAAFQSSTALKLVNAREWFRVPAALQQWHLVTDPETGKKVPSRGLLIRRLEESALFLADPLPKE